MAHGDAREGKWRGKMRMEWVASSLALYVGTWSIHGLSADPHSSTVSSRLNWPPPRRFKWTRPFCRKTKSGFCACAITFRTGCTTKKDRDSWPKRCPVKQGTPRHYNTKFNILAIIWSLIPQRGSTPRRPGRQTISRNSNRTAVVWLQHAAFEASEAISHNCTVGRLLQTSMHSSHSYFFHGRHAVTNYWTNNFFNRSEYIFLGSLTINHWRRL